MKKTTLIAVISMLFFGCAAMTNVLNDADEALKIPSVHSLLTNTEVTSRLKEALSVGTNNSTSLISKLDGFYKNPEIFTPSLLAVIKVKEKIEYTNLNNQVNKFLHKLKNPKETVNKEAAPIFVNTIMSMIISAEFSILSADDNAATVYLKEKTSTQLKTKFNPVVKDATTTVEATKYWNPIIKTSNKISFIEKQNPDLEDYVTSKAMDGLFLMIATEEQQTSKDPLARVTNISKKVFG
jgi:hypothetical protein